MEAAPRKVMLQKHAEASRIPQEGCCFPMEILGDILGLGGCLSTSI